MMKQKNGLLKKRLDLDMTQDKVAELAKISRPYYVNIEVGRKKPSLQVAKKIADVLSSTVDEIFFEPSVPKRNKRKSI